MSRGLRNAEVGGMEKSESSLRGVREMMIDSELNTSYDITWDVEESSYMR